MKIYTEGTHPFSHLGPGPYRVVGVYEKRGPIDLGNGFFAGAPGQPMGVCDHCGTGIAEVWVVEDKNKHRFNVGCDCVMKAYAAFNDDRQANGLRPMTSILEETFRAKKRELDRQKRDAKAQRDREYVDNVISEWAEEFKNFPHPNGYKDRQTGVALTLLDYVEWMRGAVGAAGIAKLARFLKKRIAEIEANLNGGERANDRGCA